MPRNPYPFPKLENDVNFTSDAKISTKGGSHGNADEISKRLYETKTLSSSRREIFSYDPQAPNDSLDFLIKGQYDHHQEFLKTTAETLYQPETIGLNHGRKLKNRDDPITNSDVNEKKCSVESVSGRNESIHSVKGAIPSHHSAATNRGYSRKLDGGFYGC